jgi:hypothetical protein
MFNVQDIAAKIEAKNAAHRWTGGGKGSIAVLCGFRRPPDTCDRGIWSHPVAGEYYDERIPAVMDIVIAQHLVHMDDPDLQTSLSNFGMYLKLFKMRLDQAFINDDDAPTAMWERAHEVIELMEKQITIIDHATFE